MNRIDALLKQLDDAKINFEFQRNNINKYKYNFVPDSDHIRVSFGRGGFAFFERTGKLISQDAASTVELEEAQKVIREACSGSYGIAPPHYKGSGINPDWVRWKKWVDDRVKSRDNSPKPSDHSAPTDHSAPSSPSKKVF